MLTSADRFFVISDVSDNMRRAEKLFDVIENFSRFTPAKTMITEMGDPFFNNVISAKSIFAYLNYVAANRSKGIADPICFSSADKQFNFFFDTEHSAISYDYLWFTLNPMIFKTNDQEGLNRLIDLFIRIYKDFEGSYAYTEDEFLKNIYFTEESYQNARQNVPADLLSFLPEPELENPALYNLPSLHVPQTIDQFQIPNGLWWVNFFNQQQVNNIGSSGLFSIDWFKKEKLDDSNHLFILTDSVLDCNNPDHLEKLREALNIIGLKDLQKKFMQLN